MIYSENLLLCIAVPLLIAVPFTRSGVRHTILSFLTGMVVCLLAAYISGFFKTLSTMGPKDTAVYISPVVEEIMKLLPLLFYLFVNRPKDDELLQMAVAVGVGFSTFENCCYLLAVGTESLSFTLIRGMAVGVMHIVSILFFAFGLVLIRRFRAITFPAVVGALALSSTFHGLYNLLVSEPGITSRIGYCLPMVAALTLFTLYRQIHEPAK